MRILHTSDWHLGHKLYGRQRNQEFASFLIWLNDFITKQNVEVLIVSGDVFDSQAPSNRSLALYYHFLSSIAHGCCKHIIITAGNHDSPTLLDAPKELLRALNIHVISRVPDNLEEEIIQIEDSNGEPQLLVLAVPYLRDRDIRLSEASESHDAKQEKLLKGIYNHYAAICQLAEEKQKNLPVRVPVVATGHLFCKGGKTHQGDGIRELYVGNLIHVGLDCFPDSIDYLALGHLHSAQLVGKQSNRRYSGSPLAMSFEDGGQEKVVLLVDCNGKTTITEKGIPCFQKMRSLSGEIEQIVSEIHTLATLNESILLEIHYKGLLLIDDLQEQIYAAIDGTKLEVLRIQNKRMFDYVLQQSSEIKSLDDLTPKQVFLQCLATHQVPDAQHKELLTDFTKALSLVTDHESLPDSSQ
jgi:DNA repair protein SbcD/Mre11